MVINIRVFWSLVANSQLINSESKGSDFNKYFKIFQEAKETLDQACEKIKHELTSVPKNKQVALGVFIEYLAAEYF